LPFWRSSYLLPRFVASEIASASDSNVAANTLRNTRAVAERRHIKRTDVSKEVRQAQTAFEGLASYGCGTRVLHDFCALKKI
jgi:hypothetical protein